MALRGIFNGFCVKGCSGKSLPLVLPLFSVFLVFAASLNI